MPKCSEALWLGWSVSRFRGRGSEEALLLVGSLSVFFWGAVRRFGGCGADRGGVGMS